MLNVKADQEWIINRYQAMVDWARLQINRNGEDAKSINDLATLPIEDNDFLYDTFLAAGEDNNAKLIAEYFRNNGIEARYVHPRQAGIFVSSEPGNARILPGAYDKLEELRESDEVLVIPGFFGVTLIIKFVLSHVVALISQVLSLQLELRQTYNENFTDVDGYFRSPSWCRSWTTFYSWVNL